MFLSCEDGILTEYSGKERELTIPDTAVSIAEGVFAGNRYLRRVILPEGLEVIGRGAFADCPELREVRLPDTLTEIGSSAFADCPKLSRLKLPKRLSIVGANALDTTAWFSHRIGKYIIAGDGVLLRYRGKERYARIPSRVRHIGGGAFAQCRILESVSIPEGVDSIGEAAFADCLNLHDLSFPHSLNSIGSRAFAGCRVLADPELHLGLQAVGDQAFLDCTSLVSLRLPYTVQHLGAGICEGCTALRDVTLPPIVEACGEGLFRGCTSLVTAMLPNNAAAVPDGCFFGCTSLCAVFLHMDITSVGAQSFAGCGLLEEIHLPFLVKEIGDGAFSDCVSLKKLQFPDGLERIGDRAFSGCEALRKLELPESLTFIGEAAFSGCTRIDEVTSHANLHKAAPNAFDGTAWLLRGDSLFQTLGDGLLLRYRGKERRVVLPPTVKQILRDAFRDCDAPPEELVIHEGVERLAMTPIPGLRLTLTRGGCTVTVPLGMQDDDREDQRLLRFWETKDPDERQMLFEGIRLPEHRYPLLLLMAQTTEEQVYFRSACRIESPEMALHFIRTGQCRLLAELLSLQCLPAGRIDSLIGTAIAYAQKTGDTEPQVLLMHYKSEAVGYAALEDIMDNSFSL